MGGEGRNGTWYLGSQMGSGKADSSIARTLGLGYASPRLGVWGNNSGRGEDGGNVYYRDGISCFKGRRRSTSGTRKESALQLSSAWLDVLLAFSDSRDLGTQSAVWNISSSVDV